MFDHLPLEEKIKMIRFGPNAIDQKVPLVAVNLLKKYKPLINLTHYQQVAKNLDAEHKLFELKKKIREPTDQKQTY